MISPLRMLALDSDVCPTPVTRTVAPLNTYTFLKEPDHPFATINEKPKQLYYVCTMRMHVYPSRPVPVIIRQTPPHMSDRRRPPTHPDEPTARRSALARPPHRSQATIPNRHPCTPPTTCTSALSLSLDRPDSLRERETAESAYSAVSRLRAGRSPSRLTPLQSPLVCLSPPLHVPRAGNTGNLNAHSYTQ
jgi:hypothetical protein